MRDLDADKTCTFVSVVPALDGVLELDMPFTFTKVCDTLCSEGEREPFDVGV
jgi:hypothetical protein